MTAPLGDAHVAHIAALIGEPARARVLTALVDGRALAAGVLATEAGVAASTASGHLARLRDAGLVTCEERGRARYYRLAGPEVAEALEALARIAPPEPIRSLRQGTHAYALRRARTCYNHLAGRLGVAVMDALVAHDLLDGTGCALTAAGRQSMRAVGVDVAAIEEHRPALRHCVDWSEQRPHLAGPLGTALTDRLFALDWLRRGARRRVVTLTDAGALGLREVFGVELGATFGSTAARTAAPAV